MAVIRGVEQDKEPGDTVGQTDLVVVQQVTREFPTVIGVEGRGVVGGSAAGDLYAVDMAVACCPLEECAEAVAVLGPVINHSSCPFERWCRDSGDGSVATSGIRSRW